MRNTLANPFFATRVTHQVESTKMSWVSKDELKPGYDNVWFQMATVGCSPHIDFLQISAVSAAVPWKRRTGKPIDLLITYLLNTYSMIMYRDVYTSYYQWVPPFLIASACLFYLPRWDQARTTFGPFAYQGAFGWVLRMVLWIIFRQGHVRGMFLIVFNCFDMMTPRYIENREEKRDQMISYFRKRLSNKWAKLHFRILIALLMPQVHQLFHRLHFLWIPQLGHRCLPFFPHWPFPQ